jgi:uncharacterized membrane protein YkoI
MKTNKRIAGAVIGAGLLLGSLGSGFVLAQGSTPSAPPAVVQAAPQQETGPDDQVQEPSYPGSVLLDQAQYEDMSEADEATALQGKAAINADAAKAAAEAANPGTTAVKVELDNENGVLVYSVELDSGLDVKVDAGNGKVVHTEQAGEDDEANEADEVNEAAEASEAGDHDNVQEEYDGQTDDATELPGIEDAPGQ